MSVVATIVTIVLIVLIALLCVVAVLLSCLSLSGTWVVLAAAVLAALRPGAGYPGWWTLIAFLLVSIVVEVIEWFAGTWGVRRQGGSALAGFAALVGGFGGLILGSFIPIPLFGSVLGMMLGAFGLVFAVERRRLKQNEPAAKIAWGTVIARLFVVMMKVIMTLGMIAVLVSGMIVNR